MLSKIVSKLMATTAIAVASPFLANLSWATEVSSWAELKAASNTANIVFANDIVATGEEFPMPINFSAAEEQTIDGNYHSFSSDPYTGSGYYSLSIENSADLNFKNFGKYVDGSAESYTFSYEDLSGNTKYIEIQKSVNSFPVYFLTIKSPIMVNITNSVFADNGKDTDARLIYVSFNSPAVGTVNVADSIFYNNTMANAGPVVYGEKFNVNIDNSVFYGNKNVKAPDGGAVKGDGTISIKNSYFVNNTAATATGTSGRGGAVYFNKGSGHTIENAKFEGNTAGSQGGAIYLYYTAEGNYIKDSEFIGNTSTNSNGGALALGGGYLRTIDNVLFDGNTSGNKGGGLYVEELWPVPAVTKALLVKDTTFSNNTAKLGGGMYFSADFDNDDKFTARIVDTDFTSNTATKGGGLYVINGDAAIISDTKDVVFSGNTATDSTLSNAGDDIYFITNAYASTLYLNAADEKKITFSGTIAAAKKSNNVPTIDINKNGITYSTYDGETETVHNAGTTGEIVFNDMVGDENGNIFNINLYGGKLSIGQSSSATNPDGLINNNNFTVAGSSTLNTANGVIGEFAPASFNVNAAMNYEFDIDLENVKSDKLVGATINNGGSLNLSVLNIISDTEDSDLKIVYSDTNIGGILLDDYLITTSEASYDISADNDDTGSYLIISKTSELGGLPYAVKNGSDAYSITEDADEVVEAWDGNSLIADLAINGNGHAITTSNALDGIDVGFSRTLTMNNVTGMSGFNYAFSNSGTVNLSNTTINDDIINDGTLEVNENVSLGNVSGTGTININADYELTSEVSGNSVNVNNAELSGVDNLGSDAGLNVANGKVVLDNKTANVKSASFGANSTLSLAVNSLSDYGKLIAENIAVADGAKLEATLAQGLVKVGEKAELQLLSANNSDFNNFSDSFDNNMYHFEKVDKNGKYKIYLTKSAEDVVEDAGGQHWVAMAAKAYVDDGSFDEGTTAAEVANQLAGLAQNDAKSLIREIKAVAPTEAAIVQDLAVAKTDILFKTAEGYLRGDKDNLGISYHDVFSDVNIWARPYAIMTKVNKNNNIAGYDTKSIGIITGIDKKIDPNIRLGGGLQYDDADVDALRREIDVSTTVGFLYGEYKHNNWFINAIGAYGLSDYDEDKFALGSKYAAKYDVKTASMATTIGYQFKNFVPEFSLRYYNVKRDGYTDTAEQKVKASKSDYLRATSGVRFSKELGIWSPDVYVGLGYDLVTSKNNTFVELPNGSGYVVDGKRLPRLECEFNVGLNARLSDNIVVGIGYMSAYRKDYQEHTGMMRFNYAF